MKIVKTEKINPIYKMLYSEYYFYIAQGPSARAKAAATEEFFINDTVNKTFSHQKNINNKDCSRKKRESPNLFVHGKLSGKHLRVDCRASRKG